ncbi:calcium/proton exchanger [Kwoniella shandongensis]|uniref:Calcium/proton exchanger n=1 Tax=Kwoniella shandongensis TaxID=1734106 RepID=A0A5M6BWZ4_9TREE|nr:calcium/proton exchanger [Kwoniella shandongensis]KAA5526402.1 calcium/proton exchanger [Kwoniella shandongensis]
MSQPSTNESDSGPESASSPTPTIRNPSSSPLAAPSASQVFADMIKSSADAPSTPGAGPSDGGAGLEAPEMSRTGSATLQQQELGKGRPSRGDGTNNESSQQPSSSLAPTPTPASPTSQFRSPLSPGRASSIHSFTTATEDDEYYDYAAGPQTAGATESTPRGSGGLAGSQRGPPHTGFGSSFGSPNAFFNPQTNNNGSMPRPARQTRYNTSTAHPASHPVNFQSVPSGSMSRSASRARPPLISRDSAGILRARGEDDDDLRDRGAELIKERQRERKARRKRHQLEQEQRRLAGESDGITPESSAPPTGMPGDTFLSQQGRGTARSVSRSRHASADRRRYASETGGYFPYHGTDGSATPREGGLSPREEFRAPSIYSSTADDDEDDATQSLVGEIVQDVVEEETGGDRDDDEEDEEDEEGEGGGDDEGVTLRDRQDAINIEHPFGLPIWKPALYRKSRSVTRNAESALHAIPSAAAQRHLLPGNILWVILFGWWLALACFGVALLVSGAEVLGGGRGGYGKTLRGLAWYIGWPFGKYVEGEGAPEEEHEEDGDTEQGNGGLGYGTWENGNGSPRGRSERHRHPSDGSSSNVTVRNARGESISHDYALPDDPRPQLGATTPSTSTIRPGDHDRRETTVSFAPEVQVKANSTLRGYTPNGKAKPDERAPLLGTKSSSGGGSGFRRPRNKRAKFLGRLIYWPGFFLIVAPSMLFVCVLCWGFVITIPMAKLTWELLTLLWARPLEINFRSAPKVPVPTPSPHGSPQSGEGSGSTTLAGDGSPSGFTMRRAHLTAGQVAPTSGPKSTVLLCTYRAVGLQYYKYTVGGVNILFINLLPLVFFTIIDGLLLLPAVERKEHHGLPITPLLRFLTSQALIFVLALASVIPLSYFIGMAVASISAQSSIGMGAVINATFGSIIEIILYGIALTQGKGRLVEGSIVGSILAGVLLMPGASMCSGAFKRKEQKFNAKSAGVTSTMLIMAIIGTLTPTMFYQTYGTFELHCEGCPDPTQDSPGMSPLPNGLHTNDAWMCNHCHYEHPNPEIDPFYQENVKTLMYCCAAILLFSYLIGLWFSLRTHAAQIWQNPQQLMKSDDAAGAIGAGHPAVKATLAQRITPGAVMQHVLPMHTQGQNLKSTTASPAQPSRSGSPRISTFRLPGHPSSLRNPMAEAPEAEGEALGLGPESARTTSANFNLPAGYTPFLESVDRDVKSASSHLTPMRLPSTLTTEDFTRAVAVATVSALRHQGSIIGAGSQTGSAQKARAIPNDTSGAGAGHIGTLKPAAAVAGDDEEEEGGGHDAPSWTRGVSAGVLLGCTLLYAIIAEILVDVVDVVLQGSGIDEKFLGLTLFALVPNTTEFMNAMSFALNGNIALSMEIGSAYALQVCLLQIPAMVAFSAFWKPEKMGDIVDTFTLIFPRWDVIAIILSIFLLTYTYIEARSNYHRGSILVLAYVVLIMGFYYAPPRNQNDTDAGMVLGPDSMETVKAGFGTTLTKLWA